MTPSPTTNQRAVSWIPALSLDEKEKVEFWVKFLLLNKSYLSLLKFIQWEEEIFLFAKGMFSCG